MEEIRNPVGKFLDPIKIIAQLEIEKGCKVVDFGCGPGYFSFPFAKAVGTDGMVYSFDILPQMIETIESRAKFSGINNIVVKRTNLEKVGGTKLKDEYVDWVVLKDIIFQNQKREEIVREAYRILKKGGKALFVEWNEVDSAIGPNLKLRVSEKKLEEMIVAEKFSIEKTIEAGSFHYAFIAKK